MYDLSCSDICMIDFLCREHVGKSTLVVGSFLQLEQSDIFETENFCSVVILLPYFFGLVISSGIHAGPYFTRSVYLLSATIVFFCLSCEEHIYYMLPKNVQTFLTHFLILSVEITFYILRIWTELENVYWEIDKLKKIQLKLANS